VNCGGVVCRFGGGGSGEGMREEGEGGEGFGGGGCDGWGRVWESGVERGKFGGGGKERGGAV